MTLGGFILSIIFLFGTHPYDVGDRVIIDGQESVFVKEFGLISTTFTRYAITLNIGSWDGSEIYSPNCRLALCNIHNVRRSGPMTDTIKVGVGIDTTQVSTSSNPQEQLDNLVVFMNAWITEKESREILPNTFIFSTRIYDSRRIDLKVTQPNC
jgi:hypothetical protein